MSVNLLPDFIRSNYEVHETKHSCAILKGDFPGEWGDLVDMLTEFRLLESYVSKPGGRKSQISEFIDSYLYNRGWFEKEFETAVVVDGQASEQPTHKIDCFRNRIALEIEWNNKDTFYDRDLNNFRLLFDLHAVSVGIIITRSDNLQEIFNRLGRGKSYGSSTTHMSKLLPRLAGGGGGGCPVLAFGITSKLYVPGK